MELGVALRDSGTAGRPYVIVNPLLAKHMPAAPGRSLDYFMRLGAMVAAACEGERVLVVGFAETATAVGAAVASAIAGAAYAHTTREDLSGGPGGMPPVAEFLEEHSHARNQSLYLGERFKDLSAYDRLVFVDDEITTGKTILNFLEGVGYAGRIIVSALVFNGFDQSVFSAYDAEFFCLQKAGHVKRIAAGGLPDPRRGVDIGCYVEECRQMAERIAEAVGGPDLDGKDVLVLGTEEFMYPALALGRRLEKTARSVRSHSTTRSPLLPRGRAGYPIHSRRSFASVYDGARTTHLYNLEKYDTVVVVTDAPSDDCGGLVGAILDAGNQSIYYVQVRDDQR